MFFFIILAPDVITSCAHSHDCEREKEREKEREREREREGGREGGGRGGGGGGGEGGRERENFIEINRKHDDTCTNKNFNERLCGLIQGDLR